MNNPPDLAALQLQLDRPSQPVVEALGRQFNPWHFRRPIEGYELPVPASSLHKP
ncbi:MAG: hypothetical protein RL026_81 [Pseudomonadota bacterium]|jgi:hypothetical protein